ncbi:MAG: thioredoxin [Nitrososphaeria archaeon]
MSDDELEKILQKKYYEMLRYDRKVDDVGSDVAGKTLSYLRDENFDLFVSEKSDVAVDFYADWCGPCKIMSPIFEEVAKEVSPKVAFAKVNVDENPKTAEKFYIMGVPTILYFRNGKLADKTVGLIPKAVFRQKIKEIFGA